MKRFYCKVYARSKKRIACNYFRDRSVIGKHNNYRAGKEGKESIFILSFHYLLACRPYFLSALKSFISLHITLNGFWDHNWSYTMNETTMEEISTRLKNHSLSFNPLDLYLHLLIHSWLRLLLDGRVWEDVLISLCGLEPIMYYPLTTIVSSRIWTDWCSTLWFSTLNSWKQVSF